MIRPLAAVFLALSASAAPFLVPSASAAGLKVAVVAPVEGLLAPLGRQILEGARFGAEARGTEIVPVTETCEASDAASLKAALKATGAEAAIGFLCTESLEAVLPDLGPQAVPAITLSVRSEILMEDALKNGWPFWRLAPTARMESLRLSEVILGRWRGEPLALIDDGTIHGREIIDSVRTALGEIGVTATFTDTFRPAQDQQIGLVRRLSRSGATHVLVGGDRSDIAIIARDAASESVPLTILGGDALNAPDQPVPLADGVLAVTRPEPATLPSAAETVQSMRAAGLQPDGYVLPAFAAVSLLEQAKDQAEADGSPLTAALSKGPYATALGPIRFDGGHELAENPFRLMEWRDGRFQPLPAPAGNTP